MNGIIKPALLRSITAGVAIVLMFSVPGRSQQTGTDMDARLELLAGEIEKAMAEYHAPGAALAIVSKGEVIFARGFGLADVGKKIPVTPETPFFIGSTTKAFTATLLGMLVDEGVMNWDDPVEKYLPYFKLAIDSPDPQARATIRDLLSHRTGFPRMGMLWANGQLTPEEILRHAANAEPFAPFRQRFHYNNVQYLAAGMAAATAGGKSWNALIEERILAPLDMNGTRTSVREARGRGRTAIGYAWNERRKSFDPDPAAPDSPGVDSVAPAGSISASALAMTRWVRFLLAKGVANGKPLIRPETLAETWSPQIPVAQGVSYGMGWMIREWKGQPLFAHDGGVPGGFSSIVALLPESEFGFVFLTNTLQPLLPAVVLGRVPELLLGSTPAAPAAVTDASQLKEYTGRYVANFAAFSNEIFTVLEQDGRLALDIPSQRQFVLNPPNEKGLWQFALTDQIAVAFKRDEGGGVVGLTLHQAGMAFEAPREGIEVKPEIDPATLQRYLGEYRGEGGLTLVMVIQNQRLALQTPGNTVFDLHPPNLEGRWVARANAELGVAFEEGEGGAIRAMNFYRPGGVPVVRLIRGEKAVLPSVDAIMALRGITGPVRRSDSATTGRSRGRIRFPHAAVEGTMEVTFAGDDRLRIAMDFGRFGQNLVVVNGDRGVSKSSFEIQPDTELTGESLRQAQLEHPSVMFGDWRAYFDKVEVLRAAELDGRSVYIVRLESEGLPNRTVTLDAKTGDILRLDRIMILQGDLGRLRVISTYEDYREINGARLPFRSVDSNDASGRTITETLLVENDLQLAADTFRVDIPQP